MARTIIFDFDGVIVLSSRPRFNALQKAARRHGVEIENTLFVKSVGRVTEDFLGQNFPGLDSSILAKILADYRAEYKNKIIDYTVPVLFTNEFIRKYRGNNSLVVASTNNIGTLKTVLQHLDLYQHFKLIVGREHVFQQKPHPEIYLYIAKILGVEPSSCIVIEDSAVGALAAVRAGMHVYGLLNGTSTEGDFNTVKLDGFLATITQLKAALSPESCCEPSTETAVS